MNALNISDNQEELINGKSGPHIRYDPDGVEVWNGTREEAIPMSEDEQKEMDEILKDFR